MDWGVRCRLGKATGLGMHKRQPKGGSLVGLASRRRARRATRGRGVHGRHTTSPRPGRVPPRLRFPPSMLDRPAGLRRGSEALSWESCLAGPGRGSGEGLVGCYRHVWVRRVLRRRFGRPNSGDQSHHRLTGTAHCNLSHRPFCRFWIYPFRPPQPKRPQVLLSPAKTGRRPPVEPRHSLSSHVGSCLVMPSKSVSINRTTLRYVIILQPPSARLSSTYLLTVLNVGWLDRSCIHIYIPFTHVAVAYISSL